MRPKCSSAACDQISNQKKLRLFQSIDPISTTRSITAKKNQSSNQNTLTKIKTDQIEMITHTQKLHQIQIKQTKTYPKYFCNENT